MNIGIVTSGNENLRLFNALNNYDANYHIYYDSLFWSYGDKPFDQVVGRVRKGIDFLVSKKVNKIIVSPIFELYFQDKKEYQDIILPIYYIYLKKYVFQYSKVGKIGICGNHCDLENAENFIKHIGQTTILNENQKKVRKDFCFNYWCKETTMRDYFLNLHSPRQNMINKYMKLDCRYFKDANIDTLVPMQYSYFMFEKGFKNTFLGHKTNFHGKNDIFDIIEIIFSDFKIKKTDKNNIDIYFTGSDHIFYIQKKRQWLVCQGQRKTLNVKKLL